MINERVSDIILFDQEFNTKKLTYLLKQGYTYKSPAQWFAEEFQKIPSEFISNNEILTGSWDLDKKGFSRRFKRSGDIVLELNNFNLFISNSFIIFDFYLFGR